MEDSNLQPTERSGRIVVREDAKPGPVSGNVVITDAELDWNPDNHSIVDEHLYLNEDGAYVIVTEAPPGEGLRYAGVHVLLLY